MRAMRTTIVKEISAQIGRLRRSQNENRDDWTQMSMEMLVKLEKLLPSGSGIDCGTKIDVDASTELKIVLSAEFHHMNDCGMYDGWTTHSVTIRPTFNGFDITIGGRNRNAIKDYLHECYSCAMSQEIDCWADGSIKAIWAEKITDGAHPYAADLISLGM